MQDSHDLPFQRKRHKTFHQFRKIRIQLRSRYQIDQDLPGCISPTHQQMPQISLMAHLMIIGKSLFLTVIQHTGQNLRQIFMYQLTVGCGQHIIGTSLFMESQCQRAVFFGISEREFHLIAVTEFCRTSLDSLKNIIRVSVFIHLPTVFDRCVQESADLLLLHLQLVAVIHGLIHASSTLRKDGTDRFSRFKR